MADKKIQRILLHALQRNPEELNIDWFGTMLISGLLDWYELGYPQVKQFSEKWLSYQLENQKTYTVEEFHAINGGCRSRLYYDYQIPISTYAGYFGLGFACYKIYSLTGKKEAGRIVKDVGDCILHRCGRNNLGMVIHDDREESFTIPDVSYFVSPPLFLAAKLDNIQRVSFYRQAEIQLDIFTDIFLDTDKKLVKTVYRNGHTGETFWIRACGWMLWNLVESMQHMEEGSPLFCKLRNALSIIMEGLKLYQHESGGFHLLIDETDMPLETTGTAMIAYAVHKAVRLGWCEEKEMRIARRAWEYVLGRIDENGNIMGCYSGWALPAEARELDFDRPMDWMPGMLLITGAEFEK